jgi:acetyl esterase
LLWVSTNSFELGIDQTKIGVGGDSAGANLASAVALKARDRGVLKLAYQLLFYPCNERDFETPSYLAYADGFGLPRKSMQWFWEQYLQGGDHDSDPYACPSRAKDFSNLAPAIIVTAEYDPLKDDGVKYERLLKGAGVPTSYLEYKGMIHGFVNLSAITPTAQRAIAECAKRIQTLLR